MADKNNNTPPASGLALTNLGISIGRKPLLCVPHFEIAPSEVVALTGPSGAGKSTLLAAIAGNLAKVFKLGPADGGLGNAVLALDGRDLLDLPAHRRQIGMMFQDHLLFAHMSVGANLGFGLAAGGSRADRQARIDDALAEIGLEGFANRDPVSLSGGQKARVALMRALLAEPSALLLDEAFSGLDPARRSQIRALVLDHAKKRGLPVLMVTHEEEDAQDADRRVDIESWRH